MGSNLIQIIAVIFFVFVGALVLWAVIGLSGAGSRNLARVKELVADGNYDRALTAIGKLAGQTLETKEALGVLEMQTTCLIKLERTAEAQRRNTECQKIADALGDPRIIGRVTAQGGQVLMQRGELHAAYVAFQTALEKNPVCIPAFIGAADCLTLWGRFDEAREMLERASFCESGSTSGAPNTGASAPLARRRALLELSAGQGEEALNWLARAAEADTTASDNDPLKVAAEAWALALTDRAEEAEQKLEPMDELIATMTSDTAITNVLITAGRAYLAAGNAKKALPFIQLAVGRVLSLPRRALVLYYLGECNRETFKYDKAKECFDQIRDFNLDTLHGKEAQNRVDDMHVAGHC